MKLKYILSLAMLIAFTSMVEATSISVSIPANGKAMAITNGAKITQWILTTAASQTNNATISAFDAPSTNLFYTNDSFITLVPSQSQITNIYTNYFGVLTTNVFPAIVDSPVTNLSSTNYFPARFVATVVSNSSSTFGGVNYYFNYGVALSNASPNATTVTITYQQ